MMFCAILKPRECGVVGAGEAGGGRVAVRAVLAVALEGFAEWGSRGAGSSRRCEAFVRYGL